MKKKSELDTIVERSLKSAALWDEVKDRLKSFGAGPLGRSATAVVHCTRDRSGARCDPHGRAVLGARPHRDGANRRLDARAEEPLSPIIIVTHNMQQAARVRRSHGFYSVEVNPRAIAHRRPRRVRPNRKDVSNPSDERTENYVTGRFG